MGISGLLPLLKSIQQNKHLSEFSGQTLAVDAYVWLHRGVYTCATELATGKKTHKYVDYAMHRVRLLRHHNIQPYIVFDGGPLPAKKGTEVERKQKRDENLARGDALAAQGKHSQAREYYVKCIDVTPQMAFQLIKALRAESVPYVVAPYEADAQLAYLERVGLVDGIITEDSDLLVFGCRTVLFKLDAVSSTITAISRADFGAVASGGVSLVGWSDAQFRAMAILSGCDYLASIPGVGLKTAYALLRKYKTVENAVKAVRLEGKKPVPSKYLSHFALAEKVFLHQRVYDPTSEKLVHLTDLEVGDTELDQEQDAYVGKDIDPSIAKMVAEGNADPVTLLPMEDINVHYVPRAVKALPFASKDKGKGKASSAGLLNFFTPKSKKPLAPKVTSQPVKATMVVGRASGKRTLADVMDHDIAVKKKKREEAVCQSEMQSRFFAGSTPKADLVPSTPVAGPSRNTDDKENLPLSEDEDIAFEAPDLVAQEDGYLSPSPSRQSEAPDLSSPIRPAHMRQYDHTVDDFGADVISSPISGKGHALRPNRNHTDEPLADILLRNSPDKNDENIFLGPDLRELFGDDPTSDIDSFDEEKDGQPGSTTPTPSPVTPLGASQDVGGAMVVDDDLGFDFDEGEKAAADAVEARKDVVASGWWHKWARNTTPRERGRNTGVLRRQDTAITPAGRHSARDVRTMSSQPRSEHKARPKASSARNSLVFSEAPKTVPKSARRQNRSMDATDSDVLESAQKRLAPFRCRG